MEDRKDRRRAAAAVERGSGTSLSLIYLHGFASGPGSIKAQVFREALGARGWPVQVPDLNTPDFRELTVGSMVRRVESLIEACETPVALIGSSLGGYVAATVLARFPGVVGAILLAPAFKLRERWENNLGPESLAAWRRDGTIAVFHHGMQAEQPLGIGFYDESAAYPPYPDPAGAPVLVFHGSRDEVVPLDVVKRFAADNELVTLRVLDDDHSLVESMPGIVEESVAFLERLER